MKQRLTSEQLEKRKNTNKKILKFGCLPILVFFIIIVIAVDFLGGDKDKTDNGKNANKVFDVPSLIGFNIDSIRKILGHPNTSIETVEPSKKEVQSGIKEWTNYFDRGVYELEVRFNPKTRRVINFWMSSRDSANHDNEYEQLLSFCNLQEDNSKYSIEKSILNDNKLAGIIITEKTTDHSTAAYVEAKEFAKSKLQYPDEADFDWTPTYDKNEGDNNYRIVGNVVAKNGFGVKQKQTFKCVLHYKGGEDLEDSSWEIVEDISFQ
jgi:hypothetical protein